VNGGDLVADAENRGVVAGAEADGDPWMILGSKQALQRAQDLRQGLRPPFRGSPRCRGQFRQAYGRAVGHCVLTGKQTVTPGAAPRRWRS
jgi:hypothetical protein